MESGRFGIDGGTAEKLTLAHKLGYGAGDLANGLTFGLSSTFLISFYTDVLGITALAAGTLFLVARIWDAANDPMMGALADRLFRRRLIRTGSASRRKDPPRPGDGRRRARSEAAGDGGHPAGEPASGNRRPDKFRPYLLKVGWIAAAAAVLMFVAPPGLEGSGKIAWAYATYIAWGMAYTFVNIPYGSLAAVMTRDPVERSSLSVSRGLGGFVGAVAVRAAVPAFLVAFAEDEGKGFLIAAAVLGLASMAGYAASYFLTEERSGSGAVAGESPSLGTGFTVLVRNRPFLAVSLASVAMQTGLTVNGAMNVYYFRENLGALGLLGFTGPAALVPLLAAAPSVPRLVAKLGAKKTSWTASLASALLYLVLLALPSDPWLYLAFSLFAAFFLMIPNLLVWGQVSDCIDYDESLTGIRREGAVYGTYSFMRKTGGAIAGFATGAGLGRVGYAAGAGRQTEAALRGIKFLTIGIPALCMIVVFLAYRYLWNLSPGEREGDSGTADAGASG